MRVTGRSPCLLCDNYATYCVPSMCCCESEALNLFVVSLLFCCGACCLFVPSFTVGCVREWISQFCKTGVWEREREQEVLWELSPPTMIFASCVGLSIYLYVDGLFFWLSVCCDRLSIMS